jgi:chromosome segregation ATPase
MHWQTHTRSSLSLHLPWQRTRSTGGQVVDLKNAEEETRTSYDQKADRLLSRLADQDRTIASLNKQIGRALARVEEVEQEADRRAAVVEASAEQHLGNLTAGAHAQTVQRFEHVQKALQQCAARCDRVEAEMHAQVAPRVTACVQAVDALDARLRATQQAAATEAAARVEFETAYRSFLEQFQGEVAQAISSMHKKAKVCAETSGLDMQNAFDIYWECEPWNMFSCCFLAHFSLARTRTFAGQPQESRGHSAF